MYQEEEDYMEEGDESEEISNEIWQEACWTVISAYFEEKGEEGNRSQVTDIHYSQDWSDNSWTLSMSSFR